MFLINHIIFKAHKKVGVASSKFSFLYVNLRKMSVLRKKMMGEGSDKTLTPFRHYMAGSLVFLDKTHIVMNEMILTFYYIHVVVH